MKGHLVNKIAFRYLNLSTGGQGGQFLHFNIKKNPTKIPEETMYVFVIVCQKSEGKIVLKTSAISK